ncbi:hypothetical protein ACWDKQ_27625 [Saccharopolyspora sp. NPDC000995]
MTTPTAPTPLHRGKENAAGYLVIEHTQRGADYDTYDAGCRSGAARRRPAQPPIVDAEQLPLTEIMRRAAAMQPWNLIDGFRGRR